MIEVEIKAQISDPTDIKKKLVENGGMYKISLLHEDNYFNMPKGLRDFKNTDEALRVRKSMIFDKNNKKQTQKIEYFITYKGKKLDTITKTRKEIDLRIEDLDKMKEILDILGFQDVLTVKKERELFELNFENYQIEVLIDYLPILNQYFIETEYLSESEAEIQDMREILFAFLTLLGIKKEDSIKESYLELIINHLGRK